MKNLISSGSVNLGIALFALLTFLIGDTVVSSMQTIGQYFSFDVFVYSFSGGTHWSNILVKHAVPVLIGFCGYLALAKWYVGLGDSDALLFRTFPEDNEKSISAGLFVGALITAWPSIRFPQLLLFEFNFGLLVFSAFLFCVSFSISGLIGVRLGRVFWHPPKLESTFEEAYSVDVWRKSATALIAAIGTGALGSIIATIAGG